MSNQYSDTMKNFYLMANQLSKVELLYLHDSLNNAYKQLSLYCKEFIEPVEKEIINLSNQLKSPFNFFKRKQLRSLLTIKEEELQSIKAKLKVPLNDKYLTMQLLEITYIITSRRV